MKTKILYSNHEGHVAFASTGVLMYMWYNTKDPRAIGAIEDLVMFYNFQDIKSEIARSVTMHYCMIIGVNESKFSSLVADVLLWHKALLDNECMIMEREDIVQGASINIDEISNNNESDYWSFVNRCGERKNKKGQESDRNKQ